MIEVIAAAAGVTAAGAVGRWIVRNVKLRGEFTVRASIGKRRK